MVAAALIAVALVVGAIVLSRGQDEPDAAVAVAWMGTGYAAVAGPAALPSEGYDDLFGYPLAAAGRCRHGGRPGGPGRVWGRAAPSSSRPSWSGRSSSRRAWPPSSSTSTRRAVLTSTLVFVVIVGSVFPWLALGVTGTNVDQLFSVADITADPDEIDPEQVGADARSAHEILVGVSATVGLLLVLVARWPSRSA